MFSVAFLASNQNALAGAQDDPLLLMLNINILETRSGDRDSYVLETQTWLGYDLNKVALKTEIERVKGTNEKTELQLLYNKAVATFWNLQMGIRHDIDPQPDRNWAVIGFQGASPYLFDIDKALFIGNSGRSEFRFEAEYEQMITQRLALIPEIEMNFAGKADPATRTGSGLVNSELSLRLAYEVKREFSPYIGVTWKQSTDKPRDWQGKITKIQVTRNLY